MSSGDCPYCGVRLFPGELAERECSSCLQKLPVERGEPTPGRQGARRHGASWKVFCLGLNLMIASLLMQLGCLLLLGLLAVLEMVPGWRWAAADLFELLRVLLLFAFLFGLLLQLGGLALCAVCPRQSGLRPWVVGYLICLGLTLPLGLTSLVLVLYAQRNFDREMQELAMVPFFGALILSLVCWLLYCLYLRSVARFFGEAGLGDGFLVHALLVAVLAVLVPLVSIGLSLLPGGPNARDLELLLGCGSLLAVLILVVWLLVLLFRLRGVVLRAA